jgi:DNA-binding response OmpR family regulator
MKKIFILDDNEELLDIMDRLLNKDYILRLKSDSSEVVSDIFTFQPDLIVLDHTIGETNSGEVIKELKKQQASFCIPVILFSAHFHLNELANNVGAQGYIEKPSDITHIREYIKSFLV